MGVVGYAHRRCWPTLRRGANERATAFVVVGYAAARGDALAVGRPRCRVRERYRVRAVIGYVGGAYCRVWILGVLRGSEM